jgi:hypothetical protein
MAVTKTTYGTSQYVTLEGTLAEVMTQLGTDVIDLTRCHFIWDASANKVVCIYS